MSSRSSTGSADPSLSTTSSVSSDDPDRETVNVALNALSQTALVYGVGVKTITTWLSVHESTVQSTLRAKPCCWISPGPNCGKQWLRPPEMGLDPSILASGRTAIHSVPSCTYEVTSAPKTNTLADAPDGCVKAAYSSPPPSLAMAPSAAERGAGRAVCHAGAKAAAGASNASRQHATEVRMVMRCGGFRGAVGEWASGLPRNP